MELLDLQISCGPSSIRLVTVYRPPRLKKNHSMPAVFFDEFSTLLETLTLAPGYLLLHGDFNFHMNVESDILVNSFKDLLESAGLIQRVTDPTYRSGNTLDLVIDRCENTLLSSFSTITDLPSDHYAVVCSIGFAKPAVQKSQHKQRRHKDINMDAFKADIANSLLSRESRDSDPNKFAELYNSELRQVLDKQAPEVCCSITLRPHTRHGSHLSCENLSRCERAYQASGLEVHKQIYQEQCQQYTY
jgi:hypothetical protein